VQECLAANVCSDDIRALTSAIRSECNTRRVCGAVASHPRCEPLTLAENTHEADVTLYVRPHDPYSSSLSGDVFVPTFVEPPLSPSTARWMSTNLRNGTVAAVAAVVVLAVCGKYMLECGGVSRSLACPSLRLSRLEDDDSVEGLRLRWQRRAAHRCGGGRSPHHPAAPRDASRRLAHHSERHDARARRCHRRTDPRRRSHHRPLRVVVRRTAGAMCRRRCHRTVLLLSCALHIVQSLSCLVCVSCLSVCSDRFADPALKLAAIALENDVANSSLLTIRGTEGLRDPRSVSQGANLLFAGITSAAASGVWGWNAYVKPFMLTSNRTFVNLQVCVCVVVDATGVHCESS
jgi:hypothetical protein